MSLGSRCSKDGQTKIHVKDVVMAFRGLRREIDSVQAIGSREVGGVSEESIGMNSDEYTKEVQYVFGSISATEFDPRLQRESRQTEIDFISQLDVSRKRPRQRASSIPVMATTCVNEGGAKQLVYYSRLCEKELKLVEFQRQVCDV